MLRIGISACLLGEAVRYDGGHKRDAFLTDILGREVEYVPVCPEVEMGLGTPREPMRLVRRGDGIRMITVTSGVDHSDRLHAWAAERLDALAREGLSGYVLKADSPSCGKTGVKVFAGTAVEASGRGLFAAALMARFPDLPVEDERRLADPAARESFLRRVRDYGARAALAERAVSVTRVTDGRAADDSDVVAVEEPLEIRLHDRPFAVIMRTPGSDRELTAGFLLAEGIARSADDLGAVEYCRHPDHPDTHNVVNVFFTSPLAGRLEELLAERRNVLANASCGICGRVTIESLATRAEPLAVTCGVEPTVVAELPVALRARQATFDRTGGLHGAALFAADGRCVTIAEDVGRHNAVDKVIGRMLLDERLPLAGHVLVVSGRASYEIVQKGWLAGVEIICAVSAPSSLAVDLAVEAGITLIGFARDRGFNVYSHSERVRGV